MNIVQIALLCVLAALILFGAALFTWLAREFTRDVRQHQAAQRRRAHLADLGQNWPSDDYAVGTRRGDHSEEWRWITTTWPEAAGWAEDRSTDYGVDVAFVMRRAGAQVTEWVWQDGRMTKHEIRDLKRGA